MRVYFTKDNKVIKMKGTKHDKNKPQYGLIPPFALRGVAEVLTFGAKKYEKDNWIHVPDSKARYFDAAQRHIWSWKEGEQSDKETGKNHLLHAICCLMFLYEHDIKYSIADPTSATNLNKL